MALSGSFSNYPVSTFGLYCTWSATQSVTGNYSDVTLNVYLKYYSLYVGERSDSTISINGTSETYTAPAISQSSYSTLHTTLLKTKTVRVNHNTNGTKTGVALSASWRFDGTYSGVSIGTITASASVDLDAIDRILYISYITDANFNANTNTQTANFRFYTDGSFRSKYLYPDNALGLAYGGTGATSAAGARSNLGINCTSLYSGTLSGTDSITFNYGSYKTYIVFGVPSTSGTSKVSITIPKGLITTSLV